VFDEAKLSRAIFVSSNRVMSNALTDFLLEDTLMIPQIIRS
jgi:hypothetical protein